LLGTVSVINLSCTGTVSYNHQVSVMKGELKSEMLPCTAKNYR